jgi:phage tail sheath gpL-like
MTISFNDIPSTIRTPFIAIEFDSSNAQQGAGSRSLRGLMIGNRLSSGTVAAEVPTRLSNKDQARQYFGAGSQLAHAAEAWFQNNVANEVWAVGLDDDGAAVKASGSFAFSGTATETGLVSLYIGGKQLRVAVDIGDTATTIAAALETAFADPEFSTQPYLVDAVTGTLRVEMLNGGEFGNQLDLRANYNVGEFLPAGITLTVNAMASGAGNPDIQDAIDAIADDEFNIITHPYLDDTNLDALEAELLDRFGPMVQIDGYGIVAKDDTFANLGTLGDARNSQFTTIFGAYKVPTAPWQVAAAAAANALFYLEIDPARPLQTLPLKGVLPPAVEDRFTREERDQLLGDGIATTKVDEGGIVRIERAVTTYKTNSAGAEDISYRDLETLLTLSYLRWSFRNHFLLRYPRHKLASDGARFGAGQAIITPKVGKAEAVYLFTQWEQAGLVEGVDQFKRDIIVERNANDPNRLDFLLPPDLVNQFRVAGTKIAFLL